MKDPYWYEGLDNDEFARQFRSRYPTLPNAILGQELYDKVDAMHDIMIKSRGQSEFTDTRIAELCGFCAQREDGTFKRPHFQAFNTAVSQIARQQNHFGSWENKRSLDSDDTVTEERDIASMTTKYRPRTGGFKESVISAHGLECQVCGMKIKPLIEAAHIVPVALNGVDHFNNGIPLCPNHHAAFDRYLFAFDPVDKSVVFKDGLNHSVLGITKPKLVANVSTEALKIRYDLFHENSGGGVS